jgi:hypothetical protein
MRLTDPLIFPTPIGERQFNKAAKESYGEVMEGIDEAFGKNGTMLKKDVPIETKDFSVHHYLRHLKSLKESNEHRNGYPLWRSPPPFSKQEMTKIDNAITKMETIKAGLGKSGSMPFRNVSR